jgi:hypothetical protein
LLSAYRILGSHYLPLLIRDLSLLPYQLILLKQQQSWKDSEKQNKCDWGVETSPAKRKEDC